MGGSLKFEKMITPFIIQVLFWLGVLGAILGGLGTIVLGFITDTNALTQLIIGLLMMFIGPIVVRIYCELLMVVFTMQKALISIRDAVSGKMSNHLTRDEEVI